MSRSKHSTWKKLKELMQTDPLNGVQRTDHYRKLDSVKRDLESKHYIKEKVRSLRNQHIEGARRTQIRKFDKYDVMPNELDYKVVFELEDEYTFVPLTKSDIYWIMGQLPSSMSYRLKEIRLAIDDKEALKEITSGIWATNCLGRMRVYSGGVTIHCYRILEKSSKYLEHILFILKVIAMGTLIHEVAHHYDYTLVYSRKGRWKETGEFNPEEYAERLQSQLFSEIVCPYVRDKYSNELQNLNQWMTKIGCRPIPLDDLQDGGYGLIYNNYDNPNVNVAAEFHDNKRSEKALTYLNFVLDTDPINIDALQLKAHLYFHEIDDEQTAFEIYQRLMELHPDVPEAYADYAIAKGEKGYKEEAKYLFNKLFSLQKSEDEGVRVLNARFKEGQ